MAFPRGENSRKRRIRFKLPDFLAVVAEDFQQPGQTVGGGLRGEDESAPLFKALWRIDALGDPAGHVFQRDCEQGGIALDFIGDGDESCEARRVTEWDGLHTEEISDCASLRQSDFRVAPLLFPLAMPGWPKGKKPGRDRALENHLIGHNEILPETLSAEAT